MESISAQIQAKRKFFRIAAAILLFLILYGLLSCGIHYMTRGNTLGSDFYVFYSAGQAIRHHENPYSIDLARQAQNAIYKRNALPGEDELGFAYPPYALFPIMILSFIPFDWAQAFWMALCILMLVSAVYFSSHPPKIWVIISLLFFYPISFGLILGNFAIPISAILIGCFSIITGKNPPGKVMQIIIGILLAWTTCKPQFSWFFIIILLLFAIRRQERWIISSFLSTFFALILISFLMMPDWPHLWLFQASRYAEYNQTWLMIMFFAMQFFTVVTASIIALISAFIAILLTIWILKRWWTGHIYDLTLYAWAAFVIFLFHPRGKSYEQIIYLIPLILWVCRVSRISWPVIGFWFGNLLFFGLTFLFSTRPGCPASSIEWPLAGVFLWFIWHWIRSKPEELPLQDAT